jgi:hypothetical protein
MHRVIGGQVELIWKTLHHWNRISLCEILQRGVGAWVTTHTRRDDDGKVRTGDKIRQIGNGRRIRMRGICTQLAFRLATRRYDRVRQNFARERQIDWM